MELKTDTIFKSYSNSKKIFLFFGLRQHDMQSSRAGRAPCITQVEVGNEERPWGSVARYACARRVAPYRRPIEKYARNLPPSSLYRAAASPNLHHGFKLGEFITTSVQEAAAPVDPVPRLQMEECDGADLKWASEEHRLVRVVRCLRDH